MTWSRLARHTLGTGLFALLGAVAAAQSPAPTPLVGGQASPAASGTAQISGIVKNAADDSVIARARVSASADVLPEPRVAISGRDGRYTLNDLPAGSYTISVTRTGFAPQSYSAGRGNPSTPIALAAGQQSAGVDFRLVTGGSISGRILDEDGSPFAGALVDALVAHAQSGSDAFLTMASAQTDDRGEFRLFGLAPGQYYVAASDPAFRAVSTSKGVLHYSPTYFPGVPFADQAKAVVVTGIGEPPKIEFRLKLVPPVQVSGRLIAENGRDLFSAAIVMSQREGTGVPAVRPRSPVLLPDGRFRFDEVAPGHYQIRGRGQADAAGVALFGVFTIEVLGRDIENIQMALSPGAVLDGRLIVDPSLKTRPPALPAVRVRAPFVDGSNFGDALTGAVQPDGSFAVRGMMKGAHHLAVEGLPPPWIVDRVSFRGADITDVQFDVAGHEQFTDVRITITDASREVTGLVENARRLPMANTGVLIFPRVPLFWVRTSRRMRVAYTDRDGRFSVAGLPAGDYYAVASLAIDESDLGRGDRLSAWERLATPIVLARDEARTTVTLPLVAPPAGAGAGVR